MSPHQFGFPAAFSTKVALISLNDQDKSPIDNGNFAGELFIDLSKDFDSINHNILFNKFEAIGVAGPAPMLIHKYLLHRVQIVYVFGCFSYSKVTNIGVPHGSILSPLLLLLCINDLHKCLNTSKCILYDNDATKLSSGNFLDIFINNLNEDASAIADLCRAIMCFTLMR